MKVKILSYDIAKKYIGDEDYILISILDPGNEINLQHDNNRKGLLTLHFSDVDDVEFAKKMNYTLMSKDQAIAVKTFVDTWKDKVNLIIVHCTAGVCRSPGMGAAILDYLNGNSKEIFESEWFVPNRYVYKLTLETLMGLSKYNPEEIFKDENSSN